MLLLLFRNRTSKNEHCSFSFFKNNYCLEEIAMSAARLIYILGILQQETNADKAMTLHQIYDKLLLLSGRTLL